MNRGSVRLGILMRLAIVAGVGCAGYYTLRPAPVGETIQKLLTENADLQQAIKNLKDESQIGYAKVVSQEMRDGQLYTKVLFVATQPNEPLKPALKREYEVRGDVVHFDALIVKFGNEIVMDGRERAIYLWRRIYDETMQPQEGFPIEVAGCESSRYASLCERLSLEDKELFWGNIWSLSNDPNTLNQLGVHAIYGSVVYQKLEPGLIYVFKISSTGTLYPETFLDL